MPKVLICYYSQTGNTEKMAQIIAEAMKREDLAVDLRRVEDTKVNSLLDYDCIVLGSPTYYGSMAWPIKRLLDESIKYHGRLRGKVGGAFSSAANVGGGNETTILGMLNALLIHGMIIQGDHRGDHYGPVAIGFPDDRATKCCDEYAQNLAGLVKRLF
ncbi:MAG: flavodoxin domain-containing protein [Candidatus Aminicenantes bacterium]|nr:flavodoxin domain-containing protein [Candidatus Aminicenantes bacterium]MDH5742948.1 flavodoxin domain-containing protein [Candidatus Aminicenantes bacterium]